MDQKNHRPDESEAEENQKKKEDLPVLFQELREPKSRIRQEGEENF